MDVLQATLTAGVEVRRYVPTYGDLPNDEQTVTKCKLRLLPRRRLLTALLRLQGKIQDLPRKLRSVSANHSLIFFHRNETHPNHAHSCATKRRLSYVHPWLPLGFGRTHIAWKLQDINSMAVLLIGVRESILRQHLREGDML